ncbi:MAG TPA: ATP-binding protein, partial [Anaerolineaceae bacterium]
MRSLSLKLTLAFLAVSLAGVALVAALVWSITATEFSRFLSDQALVNYSTTLKQYYTTHGSWTGVETAVRLQDAQAAQNVQAAQTLQTAQAAQAGQTGQAVQTGQNGQAGQSSPGSQFPDPRRMPPFALADSSGKIVIGFGPFHTGDQPGTQDLQKGTALVVNKQTVGYLLSGGRPNPNSLESRFLDRVTLALVLAALIGVVSAVTLGLFLARTITRPIRDLTVASQLMARGQLSQQVPVRSKDEIGKLTITFNQMSADLEHSNDLRRQMTADIAHDLRTPLSVITGYLEGLKDGVIKPSPKRFAAMYDEAIFLQRLVEDLRTLSLADAGELSMSRQPTQPAELMGRLASSFAHQAEQSQVTLKTNFAENLPLVNIDGERLLQALGNLMTNALRYTPAEGEITLIARQDDGHVLMEVQDSGEGIEAEDLTHIFERFYRGDSSRQETGSGLGLAIAKSIVELQGGAISAASDGSGSG